MLRACTALLIGFTALKLHVPDPGGPLGAGGGPPDGRSKDLRWRAELARTFFPLAAVYAKGWIGRVQECFQERERVAGKEWGAFLAVSWTTEVEEQLS